MIARKDLVHQTMFLGNMAAPVPGKVVLERLGFADTVERVAYHVLNQVVNLFEGFSVFFFPLPVLLQGFLGKTDHGLVPGFGVGERLGFSAGNGIFESCKGDYLALLNVFDSVHQMLTIGGRTEQILGFIEFRFLFLYHYRNVAAGICCLERFNKTVFQFFGIQCISTYHNLIVVEIVGKSQGGRS